MSSRLRRGVAAAFFAFPLFALTACGAGFDAETGNVRPDNASAQVDDIKVQSVNLILPEGGDRAGLSARIINNGTEDQTLEAIGLGGPGQQLELTPAEGETRVTVPAGGSVALGGAGNATAVIDDATAADVRLGNAQHLVFLLSEAGEVGLSARVVPATGAYAYYADWAPEPAEEEIVEEAPADGGTEGDAAGEENAEEPGAGTEGAEGDGTEGPGTEGENAEDGPAGAGENAEDAEASAGGETAEGDGTTPEDTGDDDADTGVSPQD
ncbi:DUF461 domain-containing protein [Streptomyces sp. DSM 44915]|uniref:DUF461 domain-containing protein n=1 Tax=Streptomyces chisholmiae TaxID=3075540 RepID=A0ABU2JRI0_9ACTN|nr:DUF461 domain-containing protein [Streptomyces sp. DSM 44915]MDT0267567.1 DUF461 domain-containing protein [Streptomyces sp. DSM 44915]